MKKKLKGNPWLVPTMSWILAGMMLLSLLLPDQSFSQTENRPLARSADFTWKSMETGKTGKDLNAWFSDQIPGRNLFFHADYLIRKMSGQKEIKGVYLGRDALLSDPEKPAGDTVTENVNAINTFASQSGMTCYVLVVPGAASIQSDRLPFEAPAEDVNPVLDTIGSTLSPAVGVDVRQSLGEHASEYIFYKTDHHWTSLGAGYAAKTLLAAMGIDLSLDDFDRMPVSHSFEGTLASKTGSLFLDDEIELAVAKNNPNYIVTWADGSKTSSIYHKDALKTKDQYQVFLSSNQSVVRIETDADTDRTLLLFKDSYANSVIQYLLPCFSSITVVDPRYYYENLDMTLGSDLFTDCVFLYSYDTFVTGSSLHDVLDGWNTEHAPEQAQPEAEAETQPAEETQPETEAQTDPQTEDQPAQDQENPEA